ncbi:phage holin family protein [Oscillospiraceae bacterium PP1C4]
MDSNHTPIWLYSIITGWFAAFSDQYGSLSLLVCAAIILDILTGILKAKAAHSVNSKTRFKGFWKKLSLFAGLSFGYFLDFFELYLLSISNVVSFSFHIPFGTIIGIYIVLNECISICENLNDCGVKLPAFILRALKTANDQVNTNKLQKK